MQHQGIRLMNSTVLAEGSETKSSPLNLLPQRFKEKAAKQALSGKSSS